MSEHPRSGHASTSDLRTTATAESKTAPEAAGTRQSQAPHVQAAIAAAAQPKPADGTRQSQAPHVQATIAAAAQSKTADDTRQSQAPHVQAAIAAAAQPKVAPHPPQIQAAASRMGQFGLKTGRILLHGGGKILIHGGGAVKIGAEQVGKSVGQNIIKDSISDASGSGFNLRTITKRRHSMPILHTHGGQEIKLDVKTTSQLPPMGSVSGKLALCEGCGMLYLPKSNDKGFCEICSEKL